MLNVSDWFMSAAQAQSVDPIAALAIIVSTAIAIGAVFMQFLTLLRHEGEDAVASSFTWLLLASFAIAAGAFFWRQFGDYFLALLMGLLASGAMASFILNQTKRDVIERVKEARHPDAIFTPELDHAGHALRKKIEMAREARQTNSH